jgi:hypothetical protein
MMKHTRIICRECKRQWLNPTANIVNSSKISISGNRRDDLCDYCGSSEIEVVEYTPQFLGGDYPFPLPIEIPNLSDVTNIGESYDPSTVAEMRKGFIQPALTLLDTNLPIIENTIPDLANPNLLIKEEYNPAYDLSDMD